LPFGMSDIFPKDWPLIPLDPQWMTPNSFRAFGPEIAAQISTP